MRPSTLLGALLILLFTTACGAVQIKVQGLEHFPVNANFEITYTLYTNCDNKGNQYQCSESNSHGFVPVENLKPLLDVIGRRSDTFDHNHSVPYRDSTLALRLENAVNTCQVVLTQKKSVNIYFQPDGSCSY
ncbi:hypothetical protein FOG18_01020 [Legionella israelensis]|uniref:hypothetical protein n=1 Tax=Legionella israelensis TaxID=454 RepID=UPI00117DCDC6|nr:hypothetical protein [Legionella israelensis]QDP71262.1 hypothetical protein FOG18_01020 [Legionella israelensis]